MSACAFAALARMAKLITCRTSSSFAPAALAPARSRFAQWVWPPPLDGRPVLPRHLLHLGGTCGEGLGRTEQDLARPFPHPRPRPPVEAKRRDVQVVGGLAMLAQIPADPVVDLILPVAALLEVRLTPVGEQHPVHPELFGGGALGGPLLQGTPCRARGDREGDAD